MSKHDTTTFESLSSWLDGELAADESKFLLRRVSADRELAEAWGRWSLAAVAMRRQTALPMAADFADRVANAIAEEPPLKQSAHAVARPLWRWVGGLAVAASAALVALLAMTPEQMGTQNPSATAHVATSGLRESDLRPQFAAPADTVSATAVGTVLQFGTEREGLSPELQDYMIRHNTMLREAGIGGFVPDLDVIAHPKAQAQSASLQEDAPQ